MLYFESVYRNELLLRSPVRILAKFQSSGWRRPSGTAFLICDHRMLLTFALVISNQEFKLNQEKRQSYYIFSIWGGADKIRDERRQERKGCAQGPEASQGSSASFRPEKAERFFV